MGEKHARGVVRRLAGHTVPDEVLLARYRDRRDDSAFAELVRRHGRLVRTAASRVLHDPADIDDATQATFLVLVRRAATLEARSGLGPWLYGVAHRVAVRLRARTGRERALGDADPADRSRPADPTWREACGALHAELDRLPDRYRVPLLLCYLEGQTRDEAATALGLSAGTVKGRVRRGLETLRRRLERRGVTLSAGLMTAVATSHPGATAGDAAALVFGTPSPRTCQLVEELIVGQSLWKWAVGVAVVLVLGAGSIVAAVLTAGDPPTPTAVTWAAAPPTDAPAPVKADAAGDPLPLGALARMGSSRFHHGSHIYRLTISPDGKWIISSNVWTGYRVWDLETGREQVPVGMPANARFTGLHGDGRPAVQWEAIVAPAGKRIAAVVPDRERPITRVLDAVTGEEVVTVPASLDQFLHRPGISVDREPEVSPDGKWMLWARTTFDDNRAKKTVYIAELAAKSPTPAVFGEVGERTLFGFAFSGDGQSVVMHFNDAFELWDLKTRAVKLKVPNGAVKFKEPIALNKTDAGHAVVSPDGKTLAVAQPEARTFQLWDVASKKELPPVADPFTTGEVHVLTFSPDGRQVVGSIPGGPLRVWDVATGAKVRDYRTDNNGPPSCAFTPDGKRLAFGQLDHVVVFDTATGKPVHDFGGHSGTVWNLAFTPDGRLVSGSREGLVWDPRTGRELGGLPGHLQGLAVSRDGRQIATSGTDKKVRLRDAVTLEEVRVIDTKGTAAYNVAFSADGKELAVRGDKPGIQVYDTATGRPLRVVASGELVQWFWLTPDGRRLVFGPLSDETKVHVREWATDKPVLTFDIRKQITHGQLLSADGRFLATKGWNGTVCVCDLGTGKQICTFDTNPPRKRKGAGVIVGAVAFSPDGRTLATGSAGGPIRVWELATGGERFQLDGHRGDVRALAFSPDGTLLASGSEDRSAIVWDATGMALSTDPKHRPKDAAEAWVRLGDRDTAVGFAAMKYLAARPAEAVPLVGKHLRPVPVADPKKVVGLIEKLGSPDFAEREAAEKELDAVGEGAAEQLRTAAAAAESPEVRQRLAGLLPPVEGLALTGDRLRRARAVELVERAGTAEARALLTEWAAGAGGARAHRGGPVRTVAAR
ncbi:sigma-70 family RNA polymerase sigma factor [Frigoriglobus tundricola]|uniref:ECF RNA polymerase sigma factor SigE n=1 Tax=Frigoriglobus tundricola TaxID=2774151 RepID=A0A6M5YT14_9BACT|nr:sigma-70 family RNA polymerase sigma factor [Frigoriglobus tundricola]QJW97138.1 hypothetical protein FTUN_4703 [Frigoriglobus tundricola]